MLADLSSEDFEEESASEHIQDTGPVQFLVVLGLRFLFSCYLSAKKPSQLLRSLVLALDPFGFKSQQFSLTSPFFIRRRRKVYFKRACSVRFVLPGYFLF